MCSEIYKDYYLFQAHEAILKQIQEDREQQRIRRQGQSSASTSTTASATVSRAPAEDKPPPEKKLDDTALLQVVIACNILESSTRRPCVRYQM